MELLFRMYFVIIKLWQFAKVYLKISVLAPAKIWSLLNQNDGKACQTDLPNFINPIQN